MADGGAITDGLTLAEEDPREGDARTLFDEMGTFTQRLYPEDEELGIFPPTPESIAREGVFVVARLGGKAAGCGGVMPLAPVDGLRAMEVKRMYVREEARGRRIGEHILRELEAVARARGAQKVLLLSGPRQPSALRLYERCGYSRRAAFGSYGQNALSIFFEKRL
jgi:putative acetyltransferase